MVGSCGYDKEALGSREGEEFIDHLSTCSLPNRTPYFKNKDKVFVSGSSKSGQYASGVSLRNETESALVYYILTIKNYVLLLLSYFGGRYSDSIRVEHFGV